MLTGWWGRRVRLSDQRDPAPAQSVTRRMPREVETHEDEGQTPISSRSQPMGLPIGPFDQIRDGVLAVRSQFYRDLAFSLYEECC